MSFIFLPLALSGCAAGPTYDAYLATWKDQPPEAVIADWGPPLRRWVDSGGTENIQYEYKHVLFESLSLDLESDRTVWYCLTTFEARPGGTIVGWRYSGNHCFPPP